MKKALSPAAICILLAALHISCNAGGMVEKGEVEPESAGRTVIRIEFDLPGDDIGSPEYVEIMNRLKTSIQKINAGEIVSSGFGMGSMEIVLALENPESMNKIKKIIIDTYPEGRYRMVKKE